MARPLHKTLSPRAACFIRGRRCRAVAWQDAVEDVAGGVCLLLDVAPGAKEARFPAGFEPWRGRLLVKVAAPPSEGQANEEVRALVADFFGVPPRDVTVVAGLRDRRKTVSVVLDRATVEARLGDVL